MIIQQYKQTLVVLTGFVLSNVDLCCLSNYIYVDYSQIPKFVAEEIGLKGHEMIFGRSMLGDGSTKVDYLALCNITVGGSTTETVVKITADHEPMMLGLDVMIALGKVLHAYHFMHHL